MVLIDQATLRYRRVRLEARLPILKPQRSHAEFAYMLRSKKPQSPSTCGGAILAHPRTKFCRTHDCAPSRQKKSSRRSHCGSSPNAACANPTSQTANPIAQHPVEPHHVARPKTAPAPHPDEFPAPLKPQTHTSQPIYSSVQPYGRSSPCVTLAATLTPRRNLDRASRCTSEGFECGGLKAGVR
jgi:hypothetical protein